MDSQLCCIAFETSVCMLSSNRHLHPPVQYCTHRGTDARRPAACCVTMGLWLQAGHVPSICSTSTTVQLLLIIATTTQIAASPPAAETQEGNLLYVSARQLAAYELLSGAHFSWPVVPLDTSPIQLARHPDSATSTWSPNPAGWTTHERPRPGQGVRAAVTDEPGRVLCPPRPPLFLLDSLLHHHHPGRG